MKALIIAALLCLGFGSSAEGVPALVFSGYIDYPDRHDYRIEVSLFPSGLISRVTTFAGEPLAKYEEMEVSIIGNGARATDQFQSNRRTIELKRASATIELTIENEDIEAHAKKKKAATIKLLPRNGVLFEDDEKAFSIPSKGTMRIDLKEDKEASVLISKNRISVDGWYRSDWKSVGKRIVIREYTTMEKPGDWMDDGGGAFTGGGLNCGDLATNVMNYYLLDAYLNRHIFLPFIFGLNTGAY